jgi:hypothetical protein
MIGRSIVVALRDDLMGRSFQAAQAQAGTGIKFCRLACEPRIRL